MKDLHVFMHYLFFLIKDKVKNNPGVNKVKIYLYQKIFTVRHLTLTLSYLKDLFKMKELDVRWNEFYVRTQTLRE